jgi:dihydroflavonol-4-reductase
MKALVTGATGFIGSHIVDQLLARGDSVRALVRARSVTHRLAHKRVELVEGDVTDIRTLPAAVNDVEVVYHAAALGRSHPAEAILATNLGGTENLLTVCVAQGVERFVLISSVSVYAPSLAPRVCEDAPRQPTDPYGRSKLGAEECVRRFGQEQHITYSVLRPCRVYGEPYNYHTARLLQSLRRRVLVVGSEGCPYYNLVHAADVATATVLAGTRREAAGQTYNVTDGQGASRKEIAQTLRTLSSYKQLVITLPKQWVASVYAAQSAVQAYRRLNPRAKPSTAWRQLFIGQQYDIAKARHDLGYEPQIDLKEGLRRTLEWYEQEARS